MSCAQAIRLLHDMRKGARPGPRAFELSETMRPDQRRSEPPLRTGASVVTSTVKTFRVTSPVFASA